MVGEELGARSGLASRKGAPCAPLVASGQGVGVASVTGVARFIDEASDLEALQPGEILLAEFTLPEWREAIARAAAIVTNRGGDASHAAAVARELGVPAVIGTVDGASRRWTGAVLTVACGEGGRGVVYEGACPPPGGPRRRGRTSA